MTSMSNPSRKHSGARAGSITFGGGVCCLIVCATVAFIAWLVLAPRPASPRRRWMPIVVQADGTENVMGETRQMEFWTPSAKTRDYLHMENSAVAASEQWEVLTNDDAVLQFGTMLRSNTSVLGYRRVEVWGQGRSSFKPGWWWTMTVLTNYSVKEIAGAYGKYWKAAQPVFVEVIDNRGSDQ